MYICIVETGTTPTKNFNTYITMATIKKGTAPTQNAENTDVPRETPAQPAQPQTPTPAPVEKVYTNAKIEELKAKRIAALQAQRATEPDSDEEAKFLTEASNLKNEIAKEIAAMKQAEKDAETQAKKAERLKVEEDYTAALTAVLAISPDADLPVRQAASDALTSAKDKLHNALLSGFKATSASSSTPSASGNGGSKGGTTAAIRALVRPLYDGLTKDSANLSDVMKQARKTAIQENGFNDGTANGAIIAMERELGLRD